MSEKYVFFTHSGVKKIQLRRNMCNKYVVLHASRNIVICRVKTIVKCDSKIVSYAAGKVTQL